MAGCAPNGRRSSRRGRARASRRACTRPGRVRRAGGVGTDERADAGADGVRGDPVGVEDGPEAGHAGAERDGGQQQVFGVDEAEAGLVGFEVGEQHDLAAVPDGGEGDGELSGLHVFRISHASAKGQPASEVRSVRSAYGAARRRPRRPPDQERAGVRDDPAALERVRAGELLARRADAQRIGGGVDVVDDDDFTDRVDLVGGSRRRRHHARRDAARGEAPGARPRRETTATSGSWSRSSARARERSGAVVRRRVPARAAPRARGRLSWGGARTDYLAFNDLTIVRRPGSGQVSADLSVGGPRVRVLPSRRHRGRHPGRLHRVQLRRRWGRCSPPRCPAPW